MTIRKITGLEGGFVVIPNTTLNDNLSWEALGLLAYLASKPDDWEVSVSQRVNHSKKSGRPCGRDKTYRILKELQEAGYVIKLNGRAKGKFTGVEYIVSPTKFKDFADNSPLTDLPDTDLPDTANPTQQNKESNKKRIKQNGEPCSPNLSENEEKEKKPIKKKRKKHDYPPEYDAFFALYPKTNGSKLEAFKAWKRLTKDEKSLLTSSINHYKNVLEREQWRQAMIPARYIREEHYLVFHAPEGDLKAAESVSINGRLFSPSALLQLCVSYFRSSEWKYDRLLGPAPDSETTHIPAHVISEAQKIANGSAEK